MASLLNSEFFNFPTAYLNIVPNDIAACGFEPGRRPGLQVDFQFQLFCSIAHMSDEIRKFCILEGIFFEIGFYTDFKYLSTKEIECLIQP